MSATPPKSPPFRRKTKRLPKKRNRPSTSALRAAAAQLDYINSLSAEFKVPACVQLLSDDEENHLELENPLEADHGDDAQSKCTTGVSGRGGKGESSTSMRFQKQGGITASTTNELNKTRRHHSFISYSDSETEDAPVSPPRHKAKPPRRAPKTTNTAQARRYISLSDEDIRQSSPPRKIKTSAERLLAEIEDLTIDMEGWDRPDTPESKCMKRRQRSTTEQGSNAPSIATKTVRRRRIVLSDSYSSMRSRADTSAEDTKAHHSKERNPPKTCEPPKGEKAFRDMRTRTESLPTTDVRQYEVLSSPSDTCPFTEASDCAEETPEDELLRRITQRMRDERDIIHLGCDVAVASIEVEKDEHT